VDVELSIDTSNQSSDSELEWNHLEENTVQSPDWSSESAYPAPFLLPSPSEETFELSSGLPLSFDLIPDISNDLWLDNMVSYNDYSL